MKVLRVFCSGLSVYPEVLMLGILHTVYVVYNGKRLVKWNSTLFAAPVLACYQFMQENCYVAPPIAAWPETKNASRIRICYCRYQKPQLFLVCCLREVCATCYPPYGSSC